MSHPRLPPELVREVIRFAAEHPFRNDGEDINTVLALLLTNRDFHRETEPLLYWSINSYKIWSGGRLDRILPPVINFAGHEVIGEGWKELTMNKLTLLYRTFAEVQRIADLVVHFVTELEPREERWEFPDAWPAFNSAIPKLRNVTDMTIASTVNKYGSVDDIGPSWSPAEGALLAAPFRLTRLVWPEYREEDAEFLDEFLLNQPDIHTLEFREWFNDEVLEFSAECLQDLSTFAGPFDACNSFLPGRNVRSLKWLSENADPDIDEEDMARMAPAFRHLESLSLGGSIGHRAAWKRVALASIAEHLGNLRHLELYRVDPEDDDVIMGSMPLLEHLELALPRGESPPMEAQNQNAIFFVEDQTKYLRNLFARLLHLAKIDVYDDDEEFVRYHRDNLLTAMEDVE